MDEDVEGGTWRRDVIGKAGLGEHIEGQAGLGCVPPELLTRPQTLTKMRWRGMDQNEQEAMREETVKEYGDGMSRGRDRIGMR